MAISIMAAIVPGCAAPSLPPRAFKLLADAEGVDMGRQAFVHLKGKIPQLEDTRIEAYVGCVMAALAGEAEGAWEVAVFDRSGSGIFALPGGKVGIDRGLLKVTKNQHQLAAAMAHVMAHVSLRHMHERISRQPTMVDGAATGRATANPDSEQVDHFLGVFGLGGNQVAAMPFSRLQENEADFLGLDRMARAGFDPHQAVEFWSNINHSGDGQATDLPATHPVSQSRLEDIQSHMPSALELRQQAVVLGKRPLCD